MKSFLNKIGTSLRVLEEGTAWANKAELHIGLLKEAVRKDMKEAGSPLPLWDYCLGRRARNGNLTAKDLFQLHGQNAHFTVMGEEGDISNLCPFGWHEWCFHKDNKQKFPHNKEVLGGILGPAKDEEMKWINGCLKPMDKLFQGEHADHCQWKKALPLCLTLQKGF